MWGESWNGGPAHKGICPECGEHNGTCYDGECEDCMEEHDEQAECPECGAIIPTNDISYDGVCYACHQKMNYDHIPNKLYEWE